MHQVGTWMILVTAVLLLVLTLGARKIARRLVLPILIVAWSLGAIGFVLVVISEFTTINVILAVLFIAAGIAHGIRLKRRIEARQALRRDASRT